VSKWSASHLRAQVSENYEEVLRERREGVKDLISDYGNDYDDGEASFSESHCLFTCSIDGA
jgi:hypothetical protein